MRLEIVFLFLYIDNMKTTIDIPDSVLQELLDNTQAGTKREAVLTAIEEYNRRKRMAAVADLLGTFENFMDKSELKATRNTD